MSEAKKTLREELFDSFIKALVDQRGYIPSDEIKIIQESWNAGYNTGKTYARNTQ